MSEVQSEKRDRERPDSCKSQKSAKSATSRKRKEREDSNKVPAKLRVKKNSTLRKISTHEEALLKAWDEKRQGE